MRQRRGVRRPSAAFKGSAHAEYVRFKESPLSLFRTHLDHEPKICNLFICKRGIVRFTEGPHSFFRMHWDFEPPGIIQSAAGAAHSKTWRKFGRPWPARQRLGVRRPSAAFKRSATRNSYDSWRRAKAPALLRSAGALLQNLHPELLNQFPSWEGSGVGLSAPVQGKP